jgi:hypothetical protein
MMRMGMRIVVMIVIELMIPILQCHFLLPIHDLFFIDWFYSIARLYAYSLCQSTWSLLPAFWVDGNPLYYRNSSPFPHSKRVVVTSPFPISETHLYGLNHELGHRRIRYLVCHHVRCDS